MTSNRQDLIADQIISNFIKCPAGDVPPAGDSKFDNSALNDDLRDSMTSFALAGHLIIFDTTPLMMLLYGLN